GTPPAEPLKELPLLSNPTSCNGPLLTTISLNTWQQPNKEFPGQAAADGMTGCDAPEFAPTIDAQPTTNLADTPTGLEFGLHIPQNQDPHGLTTANLKDARVTLPPGVVVNPSSANGLGACS